MQTTRKKTKHYKKFELQSKILDSYFVTYLMHHDIFVLHESAEIEMKIRNTKKKKNEANDQKRIATKLNGTDIRGGIGASSEPKHRNTT